jgi:hypothetical protein
MHNINTRNELKAKLCYISNNNKKSKIHLAKIFGMKCKSSWSLLFNDRWTLLLSSVGIQWCGLSGICVDATKRCYFSNKFPCVEQLIDQFKFSSYKLLLKKDPNFFCTMEPFLFQQSWSHGGFRVFEFHSIYVFFLFSFFILSL